MVVQQAPESRSKNREAVATKSCYLLPLSASSPEALQAVARSYLGFLASSELPLHDICYSASARRSHHDCRMSVAGDSSATTYRRSRGFSQRRDSRRSLVRPQSSRRPQKTGFCFFRARLAMVRHGPDAAARRTHLSRGDRAMRAGAAAAYRLVFDRGTSRHRYGRIAAERCRCNPAGAVRSSGRARSAMALMGYRTATRSSATAWAKSRRRTSPARSASKTRR